MVHFMFKFALDNYCDHSTGRGGESAEPRVGSTIFSDSEAVK
jgi:hypothetical protein